MQVFIDTANLKDIEDGLKRGFARGVTTNPSLLAKEPKAKFEEHIGKIVKLIKKYQTSDQSHLSVEVFSLNPKEILKQALKFKEQFKLSGLSIKIQIGWDELEIIKKLRKEKISVNCTCNMTATQAIMAAATGADFVSLFWGRIQDAGADPSVVVMETRRLFDKSYPNSKIIAGSIRHVRDIVDAGLAGAHIVTVPPKFFPEMITHFKTKEVIEQFLADFAGWLK